MSGKLCINTITHSHVLPTVFCSHVTRTYQDGVLETWLFKVVITHNVWSLRRSVVVELSLTSRYLLHIGMYFTTFRSNHVSFLSKSCVPSRMLLRSTVRSISCQEKNSKLPYLRVGEVRDFGRHWDRVRNTEDCKSFFVPGWVPVPLFLK